MRANSVSGFPDFNQYTDTQILLDFAFDNYTSYDMNAEKNKSENKDTGLFTKFNPIFDLETSPIHLGEDGKVILPNGTKLKDAQQTITYNTNVTLQDGDNNIGEITYTYGDKTVGSTNIYFTQSNDNPVLTEGKPIETVKSKNIHSETQRTLLRVIAIVIAIVVLISVATGIILFHKKRKEEHTIFERSRRSRRTQRRRWK